MGKVYLVGAGPGSADLLTLRALRLIQAADVILFDALVSTEVLQLASSNARLINVGRRSGRKSFSQDDINALLFYAARNAEVVVRLKGGDPMIFGRAAEEMATLRKERIEFEVVPGVTAACSAAAAAKVSLTDRRIASNVSFLTAHSCEENSGKKWIEPSENNRTLVIYMPGQDYERLGSDLLGAGIVANTPCVVVSKISSADQQFLRTNVGSLGLVTALPAPAVIIVGEVAESAESAEEVIAVGKLEHFGGEEVRSHVAYSAR
jgi:uroporphyrin-III C-methyltransferase